MPFASLPVISPLPRRQLLAGLGLALVALPLLPRRAAAAPASYYTWAGYEVPELVGGYAEKHGSAPDASLFADEEEALQKLRAGFVADVAHPCFYNVARWREAGLLQPIETARLAHWADLIPELKGLPGVVDDERTWFVPCDWGTASILYRTDLVELAEESLGLLWDPRYAGRLAVWGGIENSVPFAALYAGLDPFNLDAGGIAQVRDLLLRQRPLLRFYANDMTSVEQGLASGELVAATTWNASMVALSSQGLPVRFMQPKEGMLGWVCGLVLLKDAPEPDLAYDLIDSMTRPQAGRFFIESYGYGHANARAFDLVPEATIAALGLSRNPSDVLRHATMIQEFRNRDAIVEMFESVKQGL
jgi:spermidine/putrescine transport system substrate-binding protein